MMASYPGEERPMIHIVADFIFRWSLEEVLAGIKCVVFNHGDIIRLRGFGAPKELTIDI